MNYISNAITKDIPDYLRNLPLPTSLIGFLDLTLTQWFELLPLFTSIVSISYFTYRDVISRVRPSKDPVERIINEYIKKDEAKVVNKVDMKSLAESFETKQTVAFCRCWRSETFPYCDGAHNLLNAELGENVGPLVITN
ncbi:hypothetical protein GJ496_011339 [Pomphorhynchus laevis]|nr:hypothetical protein GJ496_011339 [Pomphorhynchus laevis]